jgi:hypothetical protein
MVSVSPYNLAASSFGSSLGNAPGNQKNRQFLSYSAVSVIASGVTAILPVPGANLRYNIWGFSISVSSAGSMDIAVQNADSVVMYTGTTFNSGNGFIDNKNIVLEIPFNGGTNKAINASITGAGAVGGKVGVIYTITEID